MIAVVSKLLWRIPSSNRLRWLGHSSTTLCVGPLGLKSSCLHRWSNFSAYENQCRDPDNMPVRALLPSHLLPWQWTGTNPWHGVQYLEWLWMWRCVAHLHRFCWTGFCRFGINPVHLFVWGFWSYFMFEVYKHPKTGIGQYISGACLYMLIDLMGNLRIFLTSNNQKLSSWNTQTISPVPYMLTSPPSEVGFQYYQSRRQDGGVGFSGLGIPGFDVSVFVSCFLIDSTSPAKRNLIGNWVHRLCYII